MRLKLYRAATVPEAMARVRTELGAEALILGSRRVADGVELTAALEQQDDRPPPPDPGRTAMLAFHGVPDRLRPGLMRADLATAVGNTIRFATLAVLPEPLLLVGQPGAGKTLTVARLATRLVLAGTPPLVIAADNAKAGATEQLAAFAGVLGLRLILAGDPLVLARAMAKRPAGLPVLIDAPGINPFDPAQTEDLRALASAAAARMVLVMPAGLDPVESAELAEAFAQAGASLLIATRLDIARRLGGILAAADTARLPLTEGGFGASAADSLVPLTPALFAERLLLMGKRPK